MVCVSVYTLSYFRAALTTLDSGLCVRVGVKKRIDIPSDDTRLDKFTHIVINPGSVLRWLDYKFGNFRKTAFEIYGVKTK